MSLRHGARLAALLAASAVLLPAAAHAEKVVTHDPVGDVDVVGWLADEDAELPPTPDPAPADIVRTAAAHGDKRLSIEVHFRDLADTRTLSTRILVRTPAGAFRIEVDKEEGRRAQTTLSHRWENVECRALRARLDAGADVVAVSVPTACLSSPPWVRLGVTASAPLPSTDPAVLASTVDDGHRDSFRFRSIGTGPKIHRG